MDRSGVKKTSLIGGGLSATKTKVAWNCLKWIDLVSKNFPSSWGGGGGLFCHQNKSCLKLPEMDRSGVKNFPSLGGWLFCHQNQSCLKLPEMDRSGVKKFSLISEGGGFSANKTKIAWNCLKWIDLVSKNFPSLGGGGFSATKTKVAWNCLKWIDLVSKKFSLIRGEAFLPPKPKLLEIAWNG